MAASDTPGFYEAYNDGKAGLDGVLTLHSLAAGLACSGLAFLARRLASSGFGPCSLAYSLFTALQGLVVNFHYPKFIWDNEMIVIKQSFSTILSGGIGILVLVFPLCLSLLFGMDLEISLRISALELLLLTVVLYRHLIKQGYFKEVHG